VLHQDNMLRWSRQCLFELSYAKSGILRSYILPLSYLSRVAGLPLRHTSCASQFSKVHLRASRERGGCGTKGEQYAAWPPVYLYLWFDRGI
jgi:hypothetical protein